MISLLHRAAIAGLGIKNGKKSENIAVIGGNFTSIKRVIYLLASSTIGRQPGPAIGFGIQLSPNVRKSTSNLLRSVENKTYYFADRLEKKDLIKVVVEKKDVVEENKELAA